LIVQRLVISGYKAHELGVFDKKHPGIAYIKKAITKKLLPLIEEGLEWVIVTGQQGVELWAAEVVLQLKEQEYPQLKLAILTPFLEQEMSWKEDKQEHYRSILERADFVDSITKKTYQGPWQFRLKNEFLLDHSDGMLLIYEEEKEGTPKFMREEAAKRVEISEYRLLLITAYDLELLVEDEQTKEMD
jgi:uncharacterized phage-like protein YoqJ